MSQEKANLARIRDNQRRSRARRKEYLQELEARLRQIELQGIEASSEVQLAARRVADENKKLRGLLAQYGVGDDIIEAYLQSNPINGPDARTGEQFNATSCHSTLQVQEQLLGMQKQCGGDANTGASAAMTMEVGCGSQGSSVASHQFMTRNSTTGRTSRVGHHHSAGRSVQQYQRMTSIAAPRNHTPANPVILLDSSISTLSLPS
jgi:hypothetical protein